MSRKQTIIKGTCILTITGFTTRIMGFFYRIFLSHTFGESGVGLYQLVFPVYALGFSLTSAGIELALSRCISKYVTLNDKKRAKSMLCTGIILSLMLSISTTLFLQKNSLHIADRFLHNRDTVELLLILSYAFPFASVHSCVVGYYLGLKDTIRPSVSQLIEQSFRIISVLVFYQLSQTCNYTFKISFAVLGLLIGEIASCLFCLKSITGNVLPVTAPAISANTFFTCSKELLKLAAPVTASRVLLNLLQSIEAVSIPLSLVLFGMTENDSLSTYGVLTGMALPCILFPSALTNAISTMLLPTVTEIQTIKDYTYLNKLIKKTITSCTLMGSICCTLFLIFGKTAGLFLFDSLLAGNYIMTLAWMCPFLYTNNTLISIINGMGKTIHSFFINASSLSIRILCVFIIIPSYGIYGYLIGLLISQLFVFITCLFFLFKILKAEVS